MFRENVLLVGAGIYLISDAISYIRRMSALWLFISQRAGFQ